MVRKSYFTTIKSAAIIVLVAMIAAVAVQAAVIDIDRNEFGLWSGGINSEGGGVVFHTLAELAKKAYEDRIAVLYPVYNRGQIWYGGDSVIGDAVLAGCRGSNNNSSSSVEEMVLNIIGQFSSGDSGRASFSQFDIGNWADKRFGQYAGLGNNESLKAILKSYSVKSCDDKFIWFTEKRCDGNYIENDDSQQENDQAAHIPEPSTLAILAMASFCFLVKKRS